MILVKAAVKKHLCKIVYFDESSVTDYVQISSGGKLTKTTQLLDSSDVQAALGASANASIGLGGILKTLFHSGAAIEADASVETNFNTNHMVQSIVTNTVLTDFIDVIEESAADNKNSTLCRFEGFTVSAPKDSISYVALLSPYLSMLKSGSSIAAGEFNIAVEKLDNTIKAAKGYYEFLATKESQAVILRFNIKAFKNNYKATDLLKMDLCIYAIKVGHSKLSQLNFSNEFDLDTTTSKIKDNPSYEKRKKPTPIPNDNELDVYDVLLAGVEGND